VKLTLLLIAVLCTASASAQALKLTQSISLPRVDGRIDHMSLDLEGRRLFVAALGNNTVEVVDLAAGRVQRSLTGFAEPQGILFVPEFNRLFVANGGDGSVSVLDGNRLERVATIKFDDDADNLRYDAKAKQVYVGYGVGALGIIDVKQGTVVGTIPLPGHPESFQLERNGPRLFVNVPRAHTIAVVDRGTRQVSGLWPLGTAAANFPLALDEASHRAFVACRSPSQLLVFDTQSGQEVARLTLHEDCDDLFYDAARRQLYASCGEGYIDVFTQTNADHYLLREAVTTIRGARTCWFDGTRIFLAVPRQGGPGASIKIYEPNR